MKWYQKAADQGNAAAQNNIGYLYDYGRGVPQNRFEAIKWYQLAAAQGYAIAQNHIGDLYYYGRGVIRNYHEAKKWYQKSAAQGNKSGIEKLNKVQEKISGCFITTAVCTSLNKGDDCYELTMFRRFRDNWLINKDDGNYLIEEYYKIAPTIVAHINTLESSSIIYRQIWEVYLKPCLRYLEKNENESCKELYVNMVNTLKNRYC